MESEKNGVARRKRVPVIVATALLFALFGLLVVQAGRAPGNTRSGEGFSERTFSDANGTATLSVPLRLQESDPAHEADHVFGTVTLKGVERARLVFAGPTLEVAYDPSVVSEARLRDALRAAGYAEADGVAE